MEDQNQASSRIERRILEDEDLPSDLLQRASGLPKTQEKPLFEWVMQLEHELTEKEEAIVGDVLNDGVLISVTGSKAIDREVSTLIDGARSSLKEIFDGPSTLQEQATYVLAMDVQNRVHNRMRQAGAFEQGYGRDDP